MGGHRETGKIQPDRAQVLSDAVRQSTLGFTNIKDITTFTNNNINDIGRDTSKRLFKNKRTARTLNDM